MSMDFRDEPEFLVVSGIIEDLGLDVEKYAPSLIPFVQDGRDESFIRDWLSKVSRADAEREARIEAEIVESQPILDDLSAIGVEVASTYDLSRRLFGNESSIPNDICQILLKHLRRDYADRTRDWMARVLCLGLPDGAWEEMVEIFKDWDDTYESGAKSSLGVAIGCHLDLERLKLVEPILKDGSHGRSVIGLLYELDHLNGAYVTELIESFGDDKELSYPAGLILKARSKRSTPHKAKRRRK